MSNPILHHDPIACGPGSDVSKSPVLAGSTDAGSELTPSGLRGFARVVQGAGRALRTLRERALVEDKRGVVMVEYAILIGTVALGSATAFVTLGKAFANNFDLVRGLLLCPFP